MNPAAPVANSSSHNVDVKDGKRLDQLDKEGGQRTWRPLELKSGANGLGWPSAERNLGDRVPQTSRIDGAYLFLALPLGPGFSFLAENLWSGKSLITA
jgi:hypothetical protein